MKGTVASTVGLNCGTVANGRTINQNHSDGLLAAAITEPPPIWKVRLCFGASQGVQNRYHGTKLPI